TSGGMSFDALTIASEAAHKATPAANTGALASRSMAAPERSSASPTTNVRKPAAASSFPRRTWCTVNSEQATTSAVPSNAQASPRTEAAGAKAPAMPRTAPITSPLDATNRSRESLMRTPGSWVFRCELLVRHREINDAFDQADDGGYSRPEEQQIDDAETGFAHVELVCAERAEQHREQGRGHSALAARRRWRVRQ